MGFIIAILAGVCTGSFALPMKYTQKWNWENTWSIWTVSALLFVPWIIGFIAIPNLMELYSQVGPKAIAVVFFFGFIWGFSAIAFGTGVHYLGLGLGYSLMMGMIISIGAILPLIVTVDTQKIIDSSGWAMVSNAININPNKIGAAELSIIIGVAVIIFGVILNAWAAVTKEKNLAKTSSEAQPVEKKSFTKGLVICIVAGVTAPMLVYSCNSGGFIISTAENMGVSKSAASCSIWPIALSAGFLTNLIYCFWLVHKNKGWKLYLAQGTKRNYFYAALMGLLWAGSIYIFGIAAAQLGNKGPSIGWAVFNAVGIFWANSLGLLTGEWKGAGKKALTLMTIGLFILLVGVVIVGRAKDIS